MCPTSVPAAGLKLDRMNATGIADLKYRQTYPDETVHNIGLERYYGTHDIKRNIEMRSVYSDLVNETNWLSCCLEGCSGIDPVNSGGWGESEVFDCVCG